MSVKLFKMPDKHKQITLFALLVTLLMLALTLAYWYKEQMAASEKRQSVFAESADQIASSITLRLSRYELFLRGVKGFFEGSGFVTQAEYRSYVEALQMSKALPGLQGIAVALYLPAHDKQRFIGYMHKRGIEHFQIKPAGEREDYAPIVLIEPYAGANLVAMGFDLYSNPAIKPALLKARDTNMMALTGKTRLIQDAGLDIPASVMYVPIYKSQQHLDSLEGRRAALLGWVSGPIRIQDLMASLDRVVDKDLAVRIYEGDTLSAEHRLYGVEQEYQGFTTRKTIDVGGKRWTLVVSTLPSFNARFSDSLQQQIAFAGVALSFLIGLLVWLLGTGRERAIALAKDMTQELREAQTDLECTLNAMPDILFEFDIEGRYYHYHTTQASLLAAPPEVFLGKKIADILPAEATAICMAALHEANEHGLSSGKQIEIPVGSGLRWFELSVARKDNSAQGLRFVMISRDITERKLQDSQLRIAAIAFEAQEGMLVTDAAHKILRVNQSFTDITGYSAEEVIGQTPSILNSGRQDAAFYDAMWAAINSQGAWGGEIWNRRKDGEIYPEHLTISAVTDNAGRVTNYVATMTDITKSKAALDEINMLAFYDPLTHLPNRRLLVDRLNQALALNARSNQKGALLFLDLDHFKTLNDTLGHDVGDMLLQQVAQRLTACVREGDTVARLGGDEFVVLLEDLSGQSLTAAANIEGVAEKILCALREPYQLGIHLCHTSISIGVALLDERRINIDELMKQADIAMYEAKSAGRNTMRFFDPKMQSAIAARAELELELRKAIELQQFELYYQVQVDAGGDCVGAEVLIRWQHPERGLIPPFSFISLAEETGLILPIGQWVLEAACQQLKRWEQNPLTQHLTLSVNVSARQFHQADFVEQVQAIVSHYGINLSLLNLELTESMLLDDIHGMIASMNKLTEIGIRFELDDFGTGYSSLQYLKQLPLSQLKIDQSFVRDIAVDRNDRTLVDTIINMAHSLDLSVIAEGVETEAQLQFLLAHGCNHYQGYFFSKPVPIAEFEHLLQNCGAFQQQLQQLAASVD